MGSYVELNLMQGEHVGYAGLKSLAYCTWNRSGYFVGAAFLA